MTTQRRIERLAKLNLAQMRTMRVMCDRSARSQVTARARSWELGDACARTKLPYNYPGDGRELQAIYQAALKAAR